jgi:hypothetical protein
MGGGLLVIQIGTELTHPAELKKAAQAGFFNSARW